MPAPVADPVPYSDMHPSNSPRCKAQLLRYILAIKDEFRDRDPDYVSFFNYVANNFKYDGRLVFDSPHKLYDFLTREVRIWTAESSGKAAKVRIGHEHGSDYDILMNTFGKSLDNIILDHWHWMVSQPRHTLHLKFNEVPESYRAKVKKLVETQGQRVVKAGDARVHANRAAEMLNASRTEMSHFQYDAVKLERVVNAAMKRAIEEGKPDLANSVHLIYTDSLKDFQLRELLEKTLTQRCDDDDIRRFQEYVRAAKKKLRQDRTASTPSSTLKASLKRTSAEVAGSTQSQNESERASKTPRLAREKETSHTQPLKDVVYTLPLKSTISVNGGSKSDPSCSAPGRLYSHNATEDSGYGSEKAGDKADDGSTKRTTPSEDSSTKRKTSPGTGTSSEEEAEREDLEEARRASKRRRRAGSEGSGSYHPSEGERRKKSTRRTTKLQRSGRPSLDSSPLSDLPDGVDIEQAKEAYVDEMVRRKSAEASRQAIEERYGPVSPSVVDARSEPTEDWASMPSPTMEPVNPAAVAQQAIKNATDQAVGGAQDDQTQAKTIKDAQAVPVTATTQTTQPEGFTPAEEAKAYKLISATVAESIAPYFKHIETKLEKLEEEQKSQASATNISIPSLEEIKKAAEAMKSGALRGNNPEVTQLIAQMLNNAAEASIHAADAARKAGEVARDVGKVLLLVSPQNGTAGETPRSQRKKK